MSNFPDDNTSGYEVPQFEAGSANIDAKNELAQDFEEKQVAPPINDGAESLALNITATNAEQNAAPSQDATTQTNNDATQNVATPQDATTQTNNVATPQVATTQTTGGAAQNNSQGQTATTTVATDDENAQLVAGLRKTTTLGRANNGFDTYRTRQSPITPNWMNTAATSTTPQPWNMHPAATPTTPPKPRLTVTLALDATEDLDDAGKKVLDVDISKFWTQNLPKERLNNPKAKEHYRDVLRLGELFRQTLNMNPDVPAKFKFSCVVVDPQFEQHGLSCALEGDDLVVKGVPTQPFDGEIELTLQYRCHKILEYELRSANVPPGLLLAPNPNAKEILKRYGETSGSTEPCRLPFTINADSWDLWKVVEPPKDAPYQTPHADNLAAPLLDSDKFVFVASQRGRSHEHDGKFRDDSFAVKLDAIDGWNFFAVGDGAGSAKFSRKGSKIACDTIVEKLANYFKANTDAFALAVERFRAEAAKTPERAFLDGNGAPELVPVIFQHALFESLNTIYEEVNERNNQQGEPNEKKAELRDYHTTLLCGALKKFNDGWVLLSYWIGDGGFALYRPNGEDRALALGKPDGGEFAGQTRFFTMPEEIRDLAAVKNRVRVSFVSDFDALALATDGVSDPYFETENDLGAFEAWQKFWQARQEDEIFHNVFNANLDPAQRAENLTQGLRFKIKGNHDDRTLLLVLNPEAFAASPTESSESSEQPESSAPSTESSESLQSKHAPSQASQSPEGEN